jgi:hypothetical protein
LNPHFFLGESCSQIPYFFAGLRIQKQFDVDVFEASMFAEVMMMAAGCFLILDLEFQDRLLQLQISWPVDRGFA